MEDDNTPLSAGEECCFEENGKLVFDPSRKNVDLSEKSDEELNEICKIIPQCDEIYIECKELSSVKDLKFKDNAAVYLGGVEDLPYNLDISNCSVIDMSGRDLSKIQPQKLQEDSSFIYTHRLSTGLGMSTIPPFSDNIDISQCSSVTINGADLCNVPNLKFKNDAKVSLSGCTNLPQNLDVSKLNEINLSYCDLAHVKDLNFKDGAIVNLSGCTNFPHDLDISHCREVHLSECDLAEINNLKFSENSDVNLSKCRNIPENIDISNCKSINLSACDLAGVKNLEFKEGASVNLSGCTNLPQDLDFSNCDVVDLSGCDLANLKNLKFKEGAKVNLSGCTNIPKDIDVSNCSEINLSKCNLQHIDELKLQDGVKLNLSHASSLPQSVDFSKCSVLNLFSCDLTQINDLKFREGAKVNLQGCTVPDGLDASMCAEIWLAPKNIDKVSTGNAHVDVGGIGYKSIDFSKLNSFSLGEGHDKILGNSWINYTCMKEYIFRDQQQYDDFIKNGGTIREGITVSYSGYQENTKQTMKDDAQTAKELGQYRVKKIKEQQNSSNIKENARTNQSAQTPKSKTHQLLHNHDEKKFTHPNDATKVSNMYYLANRLQRHI